MRQTSECKRHNITLCKTEDNGTFIFKVLPFVTWIKLESIVLSETIPTRKGRYCMISITYEIKKYKNKIPNTEKGVKFVVG